MAAASIMVGIIGGYLAVDRDDTTRLESRINTVERDIAGLKTNVEWLKERERRER